MRKKLLTLLEKDHTLTPSQLSAILGAAEEDITAEIKKLEDERIIVQYHTIINWDRVCDDTVTAVIDVKITPQREVGFDSIAERIYRFPEVKNLYLMSGAYDLLVMLEGRNLKEIAQFVATKLSTIDGVISTTTHFMLKKYKETGVIMDDEETDHRLVITP